MHWRIAAGCAALIVAGCASGRVPPPSDADASTTPKPVASAPVQPTPASTPPPATAVPSAAETARHRQYYDRRHQRFYYFDPARKMYFWDNGEPKR